MAVPEGLRISIITATMNSADVVEDCLCSIARQTWSNREHIVIDGASTDGTVERIERYRSAIDVFVSERDRGVYDALNKGISHATGDVVGFLHADDVYASENVLSRIARAFEDESVCAVYGDLQYVRREDTSKVVRHWVAGAFDGQRLRWGWMPPHPTLYVRRDLYERIGGFDLSYKIAADYLSILRLFSLEDFKAAYVPEVLVTMRLGGLSNRSIWNIMRKSREDLAALRATGIGGLGSLCWKNVSKIGQFLAR